LDSYGWMQAASVWRSVWSSNLKISWDLKKYIWRLFIRFSFFSELLLITVVYRAFVVESVENWWSLYVSCVETGKQTSERRTLMSIVHRTMMKLRIRNVNVWRKNISRNWKLTV